MYVLTATEAISPAINRTKNLLFRPFRWGTFLKLCAVALITEGFSSNSNSHRGGSSNLNPSFPISGFSPEWIAAGVAIGLLVLLICIALFYLIVRLRFALFDCLIHQTTAIRPGWRLYREKARRFFLFNLVVGLVYLVLGAIAVLPFLPKVLHLIQESKATGQIDWPAVFALVLPLLPVVLVLILLAIAVDMVLRDFMLPHVALEDASVAEAWYAVIEKIGAEKGGFFVYAVLRILLPLVAVIGLFIVLIVPGIIIFGSLGVLVAAIHAVTVGAAPAIAAVGMVLEGIVGVFMFALGVLVTICVGGPLCVAIRNYALVFYGGRFKALGEILYPPAAAAPPNPGTAPA